MTLDASQAPQQVFYSDHSLGTSIPLPVTYVYRVIAISSGGLESAPSNLAYATVCDLLFPDSPIQGGVTPIRGSHVAQLRRGIDAVHAAAGLQAHVDHLRIRRVARRADEHHAGRHRIVFRIVEHDELFDRGLRELEMRPVRRAPLNAPST